MGVEHVTCKVRVRGTADIGLLQTAVQTAIGELGSVSLNGITDELEIWSQRRDAVFVARGWGASLDLEFAVCNAPEAAPWFLDCCVEISRQIGVETHLVSTVSEADLLDRELAITLVAEERQRWVADFGQGQMPLTPREAVRWIVRNHRGT